MRINLSKIIEMSGESLPFSCELEIERLLCPSIKEFLSAPIAEGKITNNAGALSLYATIKTDFVANCDRCGKEFKDHQELDVFMKLAADLEDEENDEIFPLDGNFLELSDALETWYILNTEAKFLCDENCLGLCSMCGKNLNEGPCDCKKQIDPRMAVLAQLLDR